MTMTRKQSLSAMQSEKLAVPSRDNLSRSAARGLLDAIRSVGEKKRRLIAAELAMRLWLRSLTLEGPY